MALYLGQLLLQNRQKHHYATHHPLMELSDSEKQPGRLWFNEFLFKNYEQT
jgi:hypothetical protein